MDPVEVAEEAHPRVERVAVGGLPVENAQGPLGEPRQLALGETGRSRPLGHTRDERERPGPSQRGVGAEPVVRRRRNQALVNEESEGLALPAVQRAGVLGLREILRVARSEQALGPLGPAGGGHEVAGEGGAAGESAAHRAVAPAAVQGRLEPDGPRTHLGVGGDSLEPRGRGVGGVDHPEGLQQGDVVGGLRPAREVAPRGGGRPHRVQRRALREAGHPAQVRGVVVEDGRAFLGVSPAGRRVVGVNGPAAPRGDDPPRILDRAVGQGVLRGLPPVDLAGGCRADVVALRGVVAEVGERVGPRRNRLRLERLDLREGLGRELVRDDAPQVVLQVDDVDDREPALLGGPDLEEAPVGCRVRLQQLRRNGGGHDRQLELVSRLDQAQAPRAPAS